ncbi:MAG TPA: hypothetical protein DEQ43_20970 [Nocardioides bacterium]|uniref:universal stress protein n=1 Tax=uncultured Nocardioides sp. TaxID=198441 RepID=UPI000EE181DF|nr:universal stress protein [uncultured Nocardioides sp.]HCB06680.1 hypothetical protein [Nocardioides sp.]HRD61718.1 universal stress protein [Nocardioides sp.]
MNPDPAVVLAVDPEHPLSEGTVRFVVDSAKRLDLDIELVTVVPTVVGGPTGTWEVGIPFDQLVAAGRERLDHAVARVRDRAGGDRCVSGTLLRGGVAATLIERSRLAELLVMEHRQHGHRARIPVGSIAAAVAARAHAPVVIVPAGWEPQDGPRPIVVGVEDEKRAESELWTALGLAATDDVPVQVIRAVYLPDAYREILQRDLGEEEFLRLAREKLVADAPLPESVCEQVPCTFEARFGRAVEVLVDATLAASLLVVARRDPMLPFGSHLGPVVRALLREARCPVMVVEPRLGESVMVAAHEAGSAGDGVAAR